MGDTESNMVQRVKSSSKQSNQHLNPALIPSHYGGNRVGVPPISPYSSQIPATLQPRHSRSMSQPSSFFSFSPEESNALGFTPPSPFTMSHPHPSSDSLPPRKSHRRSNSDVTFGFLSHKSPPSSSLQRSVSGGEASDWASLVKEEPRDGLFRGRRPEGEAMDDVFTAYMNLDNIDALNSFGGEHASKNGSEDVEEMESSRGSGTKKTNNGGTGSSSDSEGESSASGNVKASSGVKRRARGDIAPAGRHHRSLSMDSCFMGKLNFGDESSLKLPPSSSAKVSPTNSGEGNSSAYSVEFGNSEFTAAEMKKISADEKLAEIVMTDPKRVKRILANRISAARSKERKTKYMAELEHKVQTLQTEATTLSAQLTHLQRDSMGLTNQNSELKFRLQAMEQQAQLRDALSEKLTQEVHRLKMLIGEQMHRHGGCSNESNIPKTALNHEMFQQLSISQLQHQQMQRTNQHSSMKAKHSSNE